MASELRTGLPSIRGRCKNLFLFRNVLTDSHSLIFSLSVQASRTENSVVKQKHLLWNAYYPPNLTKLNQYFNQFNHLNASRSVTLLLSSPALSFLASFPSRSMTKILILIYRYTGFEMGVSSSMMEGSGVSVQALRFFVPQFRHGALTASRSRWILCTPCYSSVLSNVSKVKLSP